MKAKNRSIYATAGVLALLMAGLIYAWSVLSTPIAAEFPEWTKAQLSLTFTLVMAMFCVGSLAGGILSAKVDPRVLSLASAALFLIGFFVTSRLESLATLYVGFGVICGLASGLIYNVVMSTISRRFADCQGLISGILLMGFGISSFLIGKLYQAFTPDTIGAWRGTFLWIGVVVAFVLVLCTPFLSRPQNAPAAKVAAARPQGRDISTVNMLKTPTFWLYYLWSAMLSAAGLVLVSQATGMATELDIVVSMDTLTTVVGLISVCNGIGRVIFGGMFDKKGRQATMMLVNGMFALTSAILLVALFTNNFVLIVAGFIVGGFAYGGVTPTNSAFINAYYGQKYYRVNFPVVNTNLLVASFGSTIAGALFDASRSYFSTYVLILSLALVGAIVTYAIHLYDQKNRVVLATGKAVDSPESVAEARLRQ